MSLKIPFTPEQDKYLIENIPTKSYKQLAKEIGRGANVTLKRLHELGQSEVLLKKSYKSRFVKGMVPTNKGVPITEWMSPESIEKCKASRFKKGQIPHNAYPDGTEFIRDYKGVPYWMIKVPGIKKLQFKHRYLWEQKHGPIPKGYILRFKDGNTLNIDLDNLMMITRTENLVRNSKFCPAEELIPTTIKLIQLNKLIKND